MNAVNLVLLFVNLVAFTGAVLLLHRVSPRYGLTPVLVAVTAGTTILHVVGPNATFVEVAPTIRFTFGSTVLVPGILVGLLVVYVINGTASARIAFASIVGVTLLAIGIQTLRNVHHALPGGGNFGFGGQLTVTQSLRIPFTSLVSFLASLSIIAIVYQVAVNRWRRGGIWAWVGVALMFALLTDTIVFHLITLLIVGHAAVPFGSQMVAKGAAGLIVWPMAAFYVRLMLARPEPAARRHRPALDLLFGTYGRQAMALKATEAARQRIEARFQTLASVSPVGIIRHDSAGRRTYGNQRSETISGQFKAAAAGDGWLDAIHPEDVDRVVRQWDAAVRREDRFHSEFRFLHPDGTVTWVIGQAVPEHGKDGGLSGYVGTLTDITELKRAEREVRELNDSLEQRVAERTGQLEAANQELEAFSYSVSHDLRAPIRAIDGFSTMLLDEYGSRLDETGERYLQGVRRNSKRMGELIDDLLEFARLNRKSISREVIDVGKLARETLAELETTHNGNGVDFHVGTLPVCRGDLALMRQVLVNLLGNAIKFSSTRDRRVIEVGWMENGAHGEYFVRDNGVGFDQQFAPKVFGVFERLHLEEDFEGTGVGLAIVQRIIHRHGGDVRAESTPGEGATIYFTVPDDRTDGGPASDP